MFAKSLLNPEPQPCAHAEVASWVPSTSPEMEKRRASTGTLILALPVELMGSVAG